MALLLISDEGHSPPHSPTPAVNGQYQDAWNANENQMKLKNAPSFTLYFKLCEYFLKKL